MLVEFTRQLNKIEREMWELEDKSRTAEPYYYRLTGMRLMTIQLKEFYEKQMLAKNRIIPEEVPNEYTENDHHGDH